MKHRSVGHHAHEYPEAHPPPTLVPPPSLGFPHHDHPTVVSIDIGPLGPLPPHSLPTWDLELDGRAFPPPGLLHRQTLPRFHPCARGLDVPHDPSTRAALPQGGRTSHPWWGGRTVCREGVRSGHRGAEYTAWGGRTLHPGGASGGAGEHCTQGVFHFNCATQTETRTAEVKPVLIVSRTAGLNTHEHTPAHSMDGGSRARQPVDAQPTDIRASTEVQAAASMRQRRIRHGSARPTPQHARRKEQTQARPKVASGVLVRDADTCNRLWTSHSA